jgi:hypothetical protein
MTKTAAIARDLLRARAAWQITFLTIAALDAGLASAEGPNQSSWRLQIAQTAKRPKAASGPPGPAIQGSMTLRCQFSGSAHLTADTKTVRGEVQEGNVEQGQVDFLVVEGRLLLVAKDGG